MTFDADNHFIPSVGWGMTLFNGSLAKNVSLVAEQIIQAQLDMFLQDTSRAVDITPAHLRIVPCLYSPAFANSTPCERAYLMAGVEFTPPVLDNGASQMEKQVILATAQQSYILEFIEQPGDMVYDNKDCQIYGFPFSAFNLCMRNQANNVLQARTYHFILRE
jgi:hypothetical protein